MQVLRVCNFCAFSLPPAFPPCYCPLTFRHQVRWVTYRISSESYPGNQECVATCHGAEECTCVHHTIHPAPSPPDAGRDTAASRFWCQSNDCGYRVLWFTAASHLGTYQTQFQFINGEFVIPDPDGTEPPTVFRKVR